MDAKRFNGTVYDTVMELTKCAAPGVIFDIGSNIGEVSNGFAKKGYKVIAVEPQKNLLKGVLYKHKNITTINACMSNSVGIVDFVPCESHNSISTCNPEWRHRHNDVKIKWNSPIRIRSYTIAYLYESYNDVLYNLVPNYIKIDVEGFEDSVIAGITQLPQLLSFEYTDGYREVFKNCIKKLNILGASKYRSYLKVKIKNTKGKIIEHYKLCEELKSYQECMNYFDTLPKAAQGDMLVYF